MRHLKIVLTFYKSFFVAGIIVSLACISSLYFSGFKALSPLVFLKLLTLGVIIFYINLSKKKEFYYYRNLGLPKPRLWIYAVAIDLTIFISLIALAAWAR